MKNIIRLVIMIITILSVSTTPVMAASFEPSTWLGGFKVAVEEAYDASVIARMPGRCGYATPYGAKGIAFEILQADKMNLSNVFEQGLKTVQTKNPSATQVDLITMYSDGGKVVQRMQLKDIQSPSGIDGILKQVGSGKYRQAKMVGTTETAELYNAKAASKGVSKVMVDSGISTETTQRIAKKSLGYAPTAAQAAKCIGSTTVFCGTIGAFISLGESVAEGDDAADTISNTVVGGAKTAASGAVAQTAAVGAETIAVTALGSTPVALVIIPAGTFILTGWFMDNALDGVAEAAQEGLSAKLHSAQDIAEDKAKYIAVAVEESGVKNKAVSTAYIVNDVTLASTKSAIESVTYGAGTICEKLPWK